MKRARPDWLRPFLNLQIGERYYSGIGNRELLKAARRKSVRVSRRLNEAEKAYSPSVHSDEPDGLGDKHPKLILLNEVANQAEDGFVPNV